jgi:poly(3-hydroxybutyrate) depolymerase
VAERLFRENRLARGCFPALGRSARLSNIKAPMFVLAAAEDEIVALPQALAAKSLCRATSVAVRVEPGRHLSLFMGQRTLGGAWREIARWLKGEAGGALRKAPAARARVRP